MLLEGLQNVSDMQDILSDVPRKNISDRLVSRYFNSTGISLRKNIPLAKEKKKTCEIL